MELRQLRYLLKVVECGSMGQAALELGVVTSALSQQINRLESELSSRLLKRSARGVVPTESGIAFMRQAQLALRHADEAVLAARQTRVAGHVCVGLAPTTAAVVGLALYQAMQERYPGVRLHLVEGLSGHLANMLTARQLDLAVLFQANAAKRWTATTLLQERIFLMATPSLGGVPQGERVRLKELGNVPLILPSSTHGLREMLSQAFARSACEPRVVAEIDGLALLMAAVRAGYGATLQPGAAASLAGEGVRIKAVVDRHVRRTNFLASLRDEELSPAALATRLVIMDVARSLVRAGAWPGATLHDN